MKKLYTLLLGAFTAFAATTGAYADEPAAADQCTLDVTVLDKDSAPVEGAEVYFGTENKTTDATGRASFTGTGWVGKTMEVSAMKGYDFAFDNVTFSSASESVVLQFAAQECTATVIVFDADYEPVEGAFVLVGSAEGTTGANGRAVLTSTDWLGTTQSVYAYKDGYEPWTGTIDFTESLEGYAQATLEKSTCTLTIIARDNEEEPVADAWVFVEDKEAQTGENGQAVLTSTEWWGKTLSVTVYKDGYDPYETSVSFTESLEQYVIAALTPATCTLSVIVTDTDYEPLEGAIVFFRDFSELTDAQGKVSYTGTGWLGNTYSVTIHKDGYEVYEGTADFTEGLETYVVAQLTPAVCTIEFHVIDRDEEPVADATILVEGFEPAQTDENGQAKISIPGGFGKTYSFTITKADYKEFSGEFSFEEGYLNWVVATLDSTSGIRDIPIDSSDSAAPVYDIMGRRVDNPTSGFYIRDGKKVFLRTR